MENEKTTPSRMSVAGIFWLGFVCFWLLAGMVVLVVGIQQGSFHSTPGAPDALHQCYDNWANVRDLPYNAARTEADYDQGCRDTQKLAGQIQQIENDHG